MNEIVAAIRAAISEGEAIVAKARADFRIVDRTSERAWPVPEVIEEETSPPTYRLRDGDDRNIRAVVTMLRLAHLTEKPGLRKASYRDSGQHLAALRNAHTTAAWREIVRGECRLSTRRAYELIAIAAGKKSLEVLRAETAARRRSSYRAKSGTCAEKPAAQTGQTASAPAEKHEQKQPRRNVTHKGSEAA